MKKINFQWLCLIFLFLFFVVFNLCKLPENIIQSSSEVDFSIPQKVQVSFNEHIYDTTIVFNNSKLQVNFTNQKDLLDGAYVCLTEKNYKITYKDMVFNGDISELTDSFFPYVIYNFIYSFENKVLLDSYDKQRECYFIKKNIDGYFVNFECYKSDKTELYSIEIK